MTIEHVLRWAMRWTAHLASCIFPPYSSVMSPPSMLSGISGWSRTTVDTFLGSAGHMLDVFLVEVKDSQKKAPGRCI